MSYELTFIGIFLSLVFAGLTGIYPGGLIVPGYLVLYFDQPERIIGTILVSLITVGCYKFFRKYLLLFGKRRFVFIILLGGLWAFVAAEIFPAVIPSSFEFKVIGWIIPGLIANNLEKQGITVTLAALVSVLVTIYLANKVFLALFL